MLLVLFATTLGNPHDSACVEAFLGEGVCTSRRKADEVFERLMCRGMSTYLGPGLQHFAMTRAWAQALHEHLLAEASKCLV